MSGAAAAAAADHELEPKQAARHAIDSKQLEWFGQQDSARTTGEARKERTACCLAAAACCMCAISARSRHSLAQSGLQQRKGWNVVRGT
jgi:hypothetical protein